jgi:DNA-binding ferritin-like protein (Dps family)
MNSENHKDYIENLKHLQHYTWPESDYGRAEIYRINDVYVLFEIPQFGGEPVFNGVFGVFEVDKIIEMVKSWR